MQVPSEKILRAGRILRNAILSGAPHMIRDRKYHLKTYRSDGIFVVLDLQKTALFYVT